MTEEKRAENLRKQREREQVVVELTIRRVEMILLEKMGLAHINFIEEVGRGIREEMGLAD